MTKEMTREERRVAAILDRDHTQREAERARADAQAQSDNGGYPDPELLAVRPTPEWHQHGEARIVYARHDGQHATERPAKVVRRVSASRAYQLHRRGVIDDDGLAVCVWYREIYERAQLEGSTGAMRYDGHGVSSSVRLPIGLLAGSETIYEAREQYRMARSSIPTRLVWCFEAVVLGDLTLTRAAGAGRVRKGSIVKAFRQAVDRLSSACLDMAKDEISRRNKIPLDREPTYAY